MRSGSPGRSTGTRPGASCSRAGAGSAAGGPSARRATCSPSSARSRGARASAAEAALPSPSSSRGRSRRCRVAELGVAISTVGRAAALVRCLESLAEGSLRPSTVAIVDQSADGAAVRAAEAFRDRLPLRLERQSERGLAVGQNAAVRLTSEPVFAVIDDDCVADTEWLATIARVLDEDPGLAGVAGRVLPLGEPARGLHAVSSRTGADRRELGGEALPWDVGSGNNFALSREWFERVG